MAIRRGGREREKNPPSRWSLPANDGVQPYAAGTLECLHINCLLRFPFFKTNECFRLKHNYSLLITVLVTLLFFLVISTCDSRR